MKKLIVGVAAALSLVTTNAAADGPYRRPPPTIAAPAYEPPPLSWSGFYIGAGIGAGAVVHDVNADLLPPGGPPISIFSFDGIGGEGVLGTVIIGWDWQVGSNTVFGIFADFDFSDISTDFSSLSAFERASIDHDHSWSVGARLGWLANPSTLWYLTGGYTEARFESFASFPAWGLDQDRDRTFGGYFVGAGLDTRLAASNWFLRLEYRFSQFDSERIHVGDGLTNLVGVDTRIEAEPSMHTARLTLTYKFTGGYGWGWSNWGK
jgi:outer membrane immunogenic protein